MTTLSEEQAQACLRLRRESPRSALCAGAGDRYASGRIAGTALARRGPGGAHLAGAGDASKAIRADLRRTQDALVGAASLSPSCGRGAARASALQAEERRQRDRPGRNSAWCFQIPSGSQWMASICSSTPFVRCCGLQDCHGCGSMIATHSCDAPARDAGSIPRSSQRCSGIRRLASHWTLQPCHATYAAAGGGCDGRCVGRSIARWRSGWRSHQFVNSKEASAATCLSGLMREFCGVVCGGRGGIRTHGRL